jgi:hypothetical protein
MSLRDAIESEDSKMLQSILDNNDVNLNVPFRGHTARYRLTPLELALDTGNYNIIKILLDRGAYPDVDSSHWPSDIKLDQLLLRYGAQVPPSVYNKAITRGAVKHIILYLQYDPDGYDPAVMQYYLPTFYERMPISILLRLAERLPSVPSSVFHYLMEKLPPIKTKYPPSDTIVITSSYME